MNLILNWFSTQFQSRLKLFRNQGNTTKNFLCDFWDTLLINIHHKFKPCPSLSTRERLVQSGEDFVVAYTIIVYNSACIANKKNTMLRMCGLTW